MTKVNDAINAIVSENLRNPAEQADAIEALANALATAIAITSGGNTKKANDLLTGTEGYIADRLVEKCQFVRSLAR